MIAVTVTIKGSKHDTERASPLAEKNEEMMAQRLLREEKTPVVDWTIQERVKKRGEFSNEYLYTYINK